MLSAGMDRAACAWGEIVQGDDQRAWAMLAVGSPRATVEISAGRVQNFAEGDDSADRRRSQLLVAALAGLDRIAEGDASSLASDLDFNLGARDLWSAPDRPRRAQP